jgi:hypothetical protein
LYHDQPQVSHDYMESSPLARKAAITATEAIWWSGGQRWLDELRLADADRNRSGSLEI